MTYTVVIPTTWDPTRQNINDFLEAIVAGFQAAVPGVVRQFWSEVPSSLTGEVPMVYLGELRETITHDSGTRTTLYEGSIGYVDVAVDNQEANTRSNAFADYFREVFTANARIYSTGIFQETGLSESRIQQGQGLAAFMHLVVSYTFALQEGRD